MAKLTKERALELVKATNPSPSLMRHVIAVSAAMGAMAKYFDEDVEYWEAVGLLHDYDCAQYPEEEHLQNIDKMLRKLDVDEESIRAVMAHGWGICSDVEPLSNLEISLYTMDGVSGIVSAAAKMRPTGISDMNASSVTKKFKDKSFTREVNRPRITKGVEKLGIDRAKVFEICIEGLKPHADYLGL